MNTIARLPYAGLILVIALTLPARARDPETGSSPETRRPAHRLMERIRQDDPDEYRRLDALRRTDPDAFAGALRCRIREQAMERIPKRQWKGTARRGDNASGDPGDPTGPDTAAPRTRPEFEAAYDQRTARFEREIERISRQLEQLRRLLRERHRNRDRIIEWQLRESRKNHPPDPAP